MLVVAKKKHSVQRYPHLTQNSRFTDEQVFTDKKFWKVRLFFFKDFKLAFFFRFLNKGFTNPQEINTVFRLAIFGQNNTYFLLCIPTFK